MKEKEFVRETSLLRNKNGFALTSCFVLFLFRLFFATVRTYDYSFSFILLT